MQEKEKELEIHNIYSHRFRKHSLKRGTTKHVLSSDKENSKEGQSYRTQTTDPTHLHHTCQPQLISIINNNLLLSGTKKNISVQTESVALLAVEGPDRPLEIEFPQEECPPESHSWVSHAACQS